jgi:CubicO group peptidase (beta-lactamase class C family)
VTRLTKTRAAGLVAAVLLLVIGVYVARVASILAAYKAKMLCSEVFVASRDPQVVESELEVDDLTPLRYIASSVNDHARSVRSSVAGIITRSAEYHEGRGCAVRFWPETRALRIVYVPPSLADFDAVPPTDNLRAVLDRAFAEPNPERPRRTRAVVIVHNGRLVAERYAEGFKADTPLLGWSMTKTVTNALVGILVRENRLSLDRPVALDEWGTDGDPRRRITLDHLMHMSSGLRFDESAWNPVSDVTVMLLGRPDAGLYAARKTLATTPGTVWQYSSGTTNIVSRVIRQVIGDDSRYLAFPQQALFNRIGMTRAVIEADDEGTFVGSSFMYATARDWARLGLLYVQDGVWDGQRILPEGWVTYTRTPAPADPEKRYGAHVWLKVAAEYAGDAVLPPDAFHAIGHAGQFVTMIPSANLVVVRMGLTRYPDAWDHTAFVRDVLMAIEGGTHRGP